MPISLLDEGQMVQIKELHMVDAASGWATTRIETGSWHILRTSNGGLTWIDVSPPEPDPLESSLSRATGNFYSKDDAWVAYIGTQVGNPLSIWVTHDGGQSWEPSWRRLGTAQEGFTSYPEFSLIDRQQGWLHVDTFYGAGSYEHDLFRTTDGGRRWELLQVGKHNYSSPVAGVLGEMQFIDTYNAWMTAFHPATSGISVYWTADGGESWIEQSLPSPPENPDLLRNQSCHPASHALFSTNQGVIAVLCEYDDPSHIYSTTNRGQSWEIQPFPAQLDKASIEILNPNTILVLSWQYASQETGIAGEWGDLYKTKDGGKTWSSLAHLESTGRLEFPDELNGWIVSENTDEATLLRTRDGGISWETIKPQTSSGPVGQRIGTQPPKISLPVGSAPLEKNVVSDLALLYELPIENPTDLTFTPHGNQIAVGQGDGWLSLWNLDGSMVPQTLHKHRDWVYEINFGPSGDSFVSASKDGSLWVWWYPGLVHYPITQKGGEMTSVAISPDRGEVAVGTEIGTVQLWDVYENQEDGTIGTRLAEFVGHTDWVWDVDFSSHGTTLASGSADRTARLWDIDTGNTTHTLRGHTASVWRLRFSPDGHVLATASWDGLVKLWDTTTGAEIMTLAGHRSPIHTIAYSPDGDLIASGAKDGNIKLWDIQTGETIHSWRGHDNSVRGLAFSPGKTILATSSADGTVRFWGIAP